MTSNTATARAWALLADVPDPEIPVLSVLDLGIVRDVTESTDGTAVIVVLTPTYSGCPATEVIARDVRTALETSYDEVDVQTRLSPAWTTDWLSEDGKRKLHEFGIAPPGDCTCPHCASRSTEELSEFGSTPCKALWRCTSCREPFDLFKQH